VICGCKRNTILLLQLKEDTNIECESYKWTSYLPPWHSGQSTLE